MIPFSIWLDDVSRNMGATSDRDLGRKIGKSSASLSKWRHGESYPSADTMRMLARRAGMDVDEALIIRAYHMSKGDTQRAYGRIFEKIGRVVTCAILALPILTLFSYGQDSRSYARVNDFRGLAPLPAHASYAEISEVIIIMRVWALQFAKYISRICTLAQLLHGGRYGRIIAG